MSTLSLYSSCQATEQEKILLLVDDESYILNALERLLIEGNYIILKAHSGAEGLKILERKSVQVILSDQRMPEMTGVKFLTQVKEKFPDTVRIVLSGYSELNSVTEAMNYGVIFKFLTKPWEDDLLQANVKEAFQYFFLRQTNERLSKELEEANRQLAQFSPECKNPFSSGTSTHALSS